MGRFHPKSSRKGLFQKKILNTSWLDDLLNYDMSVTSNDLMFIASPIKVC